MVNLRSLGTGSFMALSALAGVVAGGAIGGACGFGGGKIVTCAIRYFQAKSYKPNCAQCQSLKASREPSKRNFVMGTTVLGACYGAFKGGIITSVLGLVLLSQGRR